ISLNVYSCAAGNPVRGEGWPMANSIQSIGAIAQVAREGAVAAARAAQTTALKTRPSAPGASDPGRPSAQARVLAKSFSAEPSPPTGIFDFRGGLPAGSPTAAEGGVNAGADAAADPTGAGGGTRERPPDGEGLPVTDGHLCGAPRQPEPWHIDQDSLGDCYFVATLAALAAQQPELIQDAISYDPDTGVFTVTLHEREGRGPFGLFGSSTREVQIEVTQDDIQDNID